MENCKIPLKYMDRREEGDTVLRQSQFVQLHLLYVFDAVCKQLGLEYVLDAGTCLGAMRHDGFIPWDDDLDVGMRRCDYKRFLKQAPKLLPEDTVLQTPDNTPERVFGISKLKDRYSVCAEQSRSITMVQPNGIFIDIKPYDDIPDLFDGRERPLVRICKCAYHFGRALKTSGGRGWFYALFGGWIAIPLHALHYLLRIVFKILLLIRPCKRMYYGLDNMFSSRFDAKAMFPPALHTFENGNFPIPNDADKILTGMYGNWRELPPESERHGGHGKLVLPFQAIMVPGSMEWDEKKVGGI